MKKRLTLLSVGIVTFGVMTVGAQNTPAWASSWPTYASQCDKWIGDVPKLDSYIIADNNDGNRSALITTMAALYQDGKLIAACNNSPDSQLNSIARHWGAAIQNAAAYGYQWAKNESSSNTESFVTAESTAKAYENQFSNRLSALGR